jgi:hypothetical protein
MMPAPVVARTPLSDLRVHHGGEYGDSSMNAA